MFNVGWCVVLYEPRDRYTGITISLLHVLPYPHHAGVWLLILTPTTAVPGRCGVLPNDCKLLSG